MEIKKELENLIRGALKKLDISVPEIILEYPAEISHGDFATNVALIVAKQMKKNPRESAERIRADLLAGKPDFVEKIEVAGPGFINFFLSRKFFSDEVAKAITEKEKFGQNKNLKGKKILVEYTDPNPFKPFHIGHLMSNAIGESVLRLFKFSGAETMNLNYQGDVGLHVAKAIYGMHEAGMPKDMSVSASILAQYIGECYVKGNEAYEKDAKAKKWIDDVNKKVYDKSDDEVNQVYDWGKKITLEAFQEIYKILGTKFDYNFFESEVTDEGIKIVKKRDDLFEESEGAIVFHAEKYDPKLHTRVFITSQGLPTYETKELGLTKKKFDEIKKLDVSISITANEQSEYFKVVLKAIEIIFPLIRPKIEHISHGMMRFASGKMSSRTGNVITGESLIADVEKMVAEKIKDRGFDEKARKDVSQKVAVAAIKYSVLRQAIAGDIIFDSEKSVSFEGDSGPYLQYSAVRANSVLEKAKKEGLKISVKNPDGTTTLERKIVRFADIAVRASEERAPHYIATYLVDLASEFNSYYATTKIIDAENPHTSYRLALTKAFGIVVTNGLSLLGIEVPEKM